jgi:hypothetical protein
MVVGQYDGVNIFQGDMFLKFAQDAGTAVDQYISTGGMQQIPRGGLAGTRIGTPPANDGEFNGRFSSFHAAACL